MNGRFRNCYKPSRVSFVTSSEKLIHTLNQQRQQFNLDGRYLVSESKVDPQTPSEPLALSKLSFEQSTAGVTKAEPIQTLTPEQSLVSIAPSELAPEPPSPTETIDAQFHQLNLVPDFEPPSNSENRFAPAENWA